MIQHEEQREVLQPADWPEGLEYVPDIFCPNCTSLIRVPRETYAWYDGPVPCWSCRADVHVEIGAHRKGSPGQGPVPMTRGFPGSSGGILLSPPRLIRTCGLPAEFQEGTGSEKIPEGMRENFRIALQGFEAGRYDDAVVRCRVTLEAALRNRGVQGDSPSRLVEVAQKDSLLIEPYVKYGQIVVMMGGRSAHDRPPVSRENALLVIGLTASLIRMLYEV